MPQNPSTLIQDRIERIRQAMAEQAVDTFLVLIAENRRYLSGFTAGDTLFDESSGALLITPDHLLLATDSRYEIQAQSEARSAGYEIFCYPKGLIESLPEITQRLKTRCLGFESARLSVRDHSKIKDVIAALEPTITLQPLEGLVETMREIKAPPEIEATCQALAIAEQALESLLLEIEAGMTEKQLAWMLESRLREKGAEGLSFDIIVAAGPNAALPHAVPTDRPLRAGEPLLFDWGARLNGYCSDTTRTVILGPPDETFQKVFRAVRDAQQKAIAAIREGIPARDVDRVARDHIDQAGFAGRFGHSLGHGTGLAIHEMPRLSQFNDGLLQAGMLVTVEPGIYLPEWGGVRLENQVVVEANGCRILNGLGRLTVAEATLPHVK